MTLPVWSAPASTPSTPSPRRPLGRWSTTTVIRVLLPSNRIEIDCRGFAAGDSRAESPFRGASSRALVVRSAVRFGPGRDDTVQPDGRGRPLGSITAMSTGHLETLHREIDKMGTDPYLLTVTADSRPHCSCSRVIWDESGLIAPAPRGWADSEALGRQQVTFLWPPARPSGHSLIVDGTAERALVDGEPMLVVAPTRAVLHRRGGTTNETDSSCRSDCIPIFPA
jgi:hypothetical protein